MTSVKVISLLSIVLVTIAGASIGILCPSTAIASGDHGESTELEHVVDTEQLTGASLFLANLYNENRLLYALVVTVTMALLGTIVAQTTEIILKLFGVK